MTGEGADTVVLGVGNELYGDDGVGVVVARELAARGVPGGVAVIEGRVGGLDLLFDMEGASRVIIIDAVDMGLAPGTVRAFHIDEADVLNLETVASLHQIGIDHVLKLGQLVGLTSDIHIVGVQPHEVSAGFRLTPVVAAAVPVAERLARRLLDCDLRGSPRLTGVACGPPAAATAAIPSQGGTEGV